MTSARDVCNMVNTYRARLRPRLDDIVRGSGTAADMLNKILPVLGLSATDAEQLKRTAFTQAVSSCALGSDANQSNVFDTSECAAVLGCIRRRDPLYRKSLADALGDDIANQQVDLLNQMCKFSATQTNQFSTTQLCQMNNLVNGLDRSRFHPAVEAIVQELVQGGAAVPLDCNKVPTEATQEQYITANQSCISYSGINQRNIAKCVRNVDQSNLAQVTTNCVLKLLAPNAPAPVMQPAPQQAVAPQVVQVSQQHNTFVFLGGALLFMFFLLLIVVVKRST
jgi:hypothetical protein